MPSHAARQRLFDHADRKPQRDAKMKSMSSAVGSDTVEAAHLVEDAPPEERAGRREGGLPEDVAKHIAILRDEAATTEHVVLAPVAVHLDDVGEHHAVVRTRLEECHLTRELLRRPLVIGIEERDVVTGRGCHASVSSAGDAQALGPDDRDGVAVGLTQMLRGAVARAVIDDDDLLRGMGLGKRRPHGQDDVLPSVERRDDGADERGHAAIVSMARLLNDVVRGVRDNVKRLAHDAGGLRAYHRMRNARRLTVLTFTACSSTVRTRAGPTRTRNRASPSTSSRRAWASFRSTTR